MFGQWTYGKDGIKPKDSKGKVTKFKIFNVTFLNNGLSKKFKYTQKL